MNLTFWCSVFPLQDGQTDGRGSALDRCFVLNARCSQQVSATLAPTKCGDAQVGKVTAGLAESNGSILLDFMTNVTYSMSALETGDQHRPLRSLLVPFAFTPIFFSYWAVWCGPIYWLFIAEPRLLFDRSAHASRILIRRTTPEEVTDAGASVEDLLRCGKNEFLIAASSFIVRRPQRMPRARPPDVGHLPSGHMPPRHLPPSRTSAVLVLT